MNYDSLFKLLREEIRSNRKTAKTYEGHPNITPESRAWMKGWYMGHADGEARVLALLRDRLRKESSE